MKILIAPRTPPSRILSFHLPYSVHTTITMSLLPPDETLQFLSRKALIDGLQTHASTNGYAITIQRSNPKDEAIYFRCDRGGVYKPENGLHNTNRQRDTGSRLLDCPFSIRANVKDKIWTIKVRCTDHNHQGTISAYAHPIQRRAASPIRQQVMQLSAAGSAPREIVSVIRQGSNHTLLTRDVLNIRFDIRARNLAGRTPTEALIAQLTGSTYVFEYKTDHMGRIIALFFACYGHSIASLTTN
jgi:hypothetical protein